jgi:predicted Rossmann-fold nucleotide-binding protein
MGAAEGLDDAGARDAISAQGCSPRIVGGGRTGVAAAVVESALKEARRTTGAGSSTSFGRGCE